MATDTPDQPTKFRSPKLLILAIDAAETTLLHLWAADGTLPNIAAMMAEGLVGRSRSEGELCLGTPWPSFFTATNPGEHGTYWFNQLIPGTYQTRAFAPSDVGGLRTLWDVLADAGQRAVVLDVPFTWLSRRSGVVQLVEWGVHDGIFGFHARPAALVPEIIASIGAHPAPTACDTPSRTAAEYRAFTNQLVRGVHARATLTRTLLAREPWDFAIQVFSEAHCAGHQLWHFHDPAHPAYDPERSATEGDLVREVYVALDSAVGELLRTVDGDTTVVLMALHGMSYMAGSGPLLNHILMRLGVMTPASGGVEANAAAPSLPRLPMSFRRHTLQTARNIYHRIPKRIRTLLYDARRFVSRKVFRRGDPLNLDPTRSQCFKIELGPELSGIRLNLKGREPEGTVAPGTEADRFCDRLIHDLLEIINPDTGQRLVDSVVRSTELFHGSRLDHLPDLIVAWALEPPRGTTATGDGAAATWRAASPRIGVIEHVNRDCRTGDHRIDGMFVARGPGITPGILSYLVGTCDLAPTFAAMLGCEMPAVDGSPIEELVSRSALPRTQGERPPNAMHERPKH